MSSMLLKHSCRLKVHPSARKGMECLSVGKLSVLELGESILKNNARIIFVLQCFLGEAENFLITPSSLHVLFIFPVDNLIPYHIRLARRVDE
jgi:hypothetical protein